MTHTREDIKESNICADPVTFSFDPAIVTTMQGLIKRHSETLNYMRKFGSITQRAYADTVFKIAASGGV
jgi:hypothetical protein